jgi:hypothetical protein
MSYLKRDDLPGSTPADTPAGAAEGSGPSCTTCPLNANCGGDLCLPIAVKGYWNDLASEDPDNAQFVFFCPTGGCVGQPIKERGCAPNFLLTAYETASRRALYENIEAPGNGANSSLSRRLSSWKDDFDDDNLAVDAESLGNTCSLGATGPLCAACLEGYFVSSSTRTCAQCSGSSFLNVFMTILYLIAGGIVLYAVLKGDGFPVPRYLVWRFGFPRRVQLPFVRALMRIDGGTIKVIYSTLQIITSVTANLDIAFPEPFASFLGNLSFIQFQFISFECMSGSTYHQQVYGVVASPVLVAIAIWAVYFVRLGYLLVDDAKQSRDVLWAQHFKWTLTLSYISLPVVVKAQFMGLNCFNFPYNGQSYLKADTSINCASPVSN